MDRTFALLGTYQMRFQDKTYQDIYNQSLRDEVGIRSVVQVNSLQWVSAYIDHLKTSGQTNQIKGVPETACGDTNTCVDPDLVTDEVAAIQKLSELPICPPGPPPPTSTSEKFTIMTGVLFLSWTSYCLVYAYLEGKSQERQNLQAMASIKQTPEQKT